jgi:hypothetical protein
LELDILDPIVLGSKHPISTLLLIIMMGSSFIEAWKGSMGEKWVDT